MGTSNKWSQIGEDIMNSVIHAVDSGDLTGLSQSVGDLINETADSISRGVNQVGKEIERQAKTRGENISNAAGAWTSQGGAGGAGGRADCGGSGEKRGF